MLYNDGGLAGRQHIDELVQRTGLGRVQAVAEPVTEEIVGCDSVAESTF